MNAFVHIASDDRISLIMPSVEMGQGVYTSQSMCLAEELDIGLDQVTAEHAPPDQAAYGNPVFVVQSTGGSTTTRAWTEPLRRAGATARAMLVQAAAIEWRVDPASLTTDRGVITNPATGRATTYGQVADRAARLKPPATVALKDPKNFRLIGKAQRRIDTADKVTGKTIFSIDRRLPGMKFASLTASPVFGGKVGKVDQTRALEVAGVRQVVILDDLVAAIGDHSWDALQGLRALDVEWLPGKNATLEQDALWEGLREAATGSGVKVRSEGDAPAKLADGNLFEASYELPFLAHAAMEPMSCVVHLKDGGCQIWAGVQMIGVAQMIAAGVLGIAAEKVIINNHIIGGAFGRRFEADHIVKALRIAQQVEGPVMVTWSREEDLQKSWYRPLYRDQLKARLDDGRIIAWHHRVVGPSIMARLFAPAFKDGIDVDAVEGAVHPPYALGDALIEYVRHETPVPVTFWRGVGPNSAAFSVERFLDLIAHKTGTDPVEFRRRHLQRSARALNVLNVVAEKAGWGTPPPSSPEGERRGRGVALLEGFGSFLAAIADVAVSDAGDVRVTRVVIAADVGRVINPDTVLAQIQGGVVFGITAVLHNRITIAGGRVEQSNFHDYRMLRIDETPVIEAHIVQSNEDPGGIGEPGTVVVQPAVANAVLAATGVDLTRMPIDRTLIAKGA
jgi:isoquinoline 1-oxidoreductase beta subunit